jgi:Xaa-Pro aminopeptidase
MAILLRPAGKSPPPPGGPGLFALGSDGALESLMADSGLSDVETKSLRSALRLPSVPDTLEMMQQAFGAYRAVVADLDHARRRAAWAEVAEFLERFKVRGSFETEFEVIVGSGAKLG